MAKKVQPESQTKRQIARSQKVRRRERNTRIGILSVIVLVIGVLIYGAVNEYVVKPNVPIATVDGVEISTRLYQKYWQYIQFNTLSSYQQYQSELDQLGAIPEPTDMDAIYIQYYQQLVQQLRTQLQNLDTSVLDSMIDDELVRQEAKKEGLTVTPEEVQSEIEITFGFDRNPPTPMPTEVITDTTVVTETATPEPTATRMSEPQFQTAYTNQRDYVQKQFNFSEQEFRSLFEIQLLRDKLQAVLAERVVTTEEQVHVRHILVATLEEAQAVVERLKAGEDFAALALELSTDTSNNETGGDLGWFGRGQMVTEFEDAAFSLEVGATSDPVQTDFGYHIIEVLEKDANHPMDEATLSEKKAAALDEWLAAQRYSDKVKRYFSSDKVPKAIQPVQ
jgi:peptidyl-prolyl cis-trans isomerase D